MGVYFWTNICFGLECFFVLAGRVALVLDSFPRAHYFYFDITSYQSYIYICIDTLCVASSRLYLDTSREKMEGWYLLTVSVFGGISYLGLLHVSHRCGNYYLSSKSRWSVGHSVPYRSKEPIINLLE
ncbi:hypothetical protein M440DRAFT_1159772 [Trichoderma longibrachiatum ATCC 18648]|uniref:Uncharacterized protein n=1 Tax=Trichoderma longibrachiatum ATCC 18648 TaxID=983965 RepID=A0A2T4CBX7_TRILO|nr:hypothetical protein M440DRAFT_1159772 [Trichoderma longibrachiatum ATCC 18648]